MRTNVKITGKCTKCNSKNIYYGKVIGMGHAGSYLFCEDCGEDLNFRQINHRRIKIKDRTPDIKRSSSSEISEAFKIIIERLQSEVFNNKDTDLYL